MISISGHKIHAPKGIGALYIRAGLKLKPFIVGGSQESGDGARGLRLCRRSRLSARRVR